MHKINAKLGKLSSNKIESFFLIRLFHSIACFVEGFDEESRILRRSLMRYMNLALILVLRSISSAVKQRFPTLDHVVEAGTLL